MTYSGDNLNMPVWEHLDALRGILLRCIAATAISSILFFAAIPTIFDRIILWPCRADFPLYKLLKEIPAISGIMPGTAGGNHISLVNIHLSTPFLIHISTAFWLGVTASFPLILYLIYKFIKPGLYDNERRYARSGLSAACILFYTGVIAGYMLAFPLTLRFLAEYQVSPDIPNTISLESYMHTFTMLLLCMGLIFELPAMAWVLGKTGLLNRDFFNRYRRHAIVTLMVLAAIVTPTADPFTLFVVFVPIYGLWELGALLVPKQNSLSTKTHTSGE